MSRKLNTLVLLCLPALCSSLFTLNGARLQATELYWDINGATPGAGGAAPAGTWATNFANWSTDSTGSIATAVWNNTNNQATFAAGTDATGTYIVTVGSGVNAPTATQSVGHRGVRINSGHITFNGGIITLSSIAFGGGFEIAPTASATMGTTTISRTGTNSGFSYLAGGGTFYTPGFAAFPGGSHVVVPSGGTWDFDTAASLGVNRIIALSGSLADPTVIQGNGSFSRPLQNANGGVYWTGGSGGGFAARGGQLDVTITGGPITFGSVGLSPGNGSPLVLGSPTADSLVNFQSSFTLGTAAQNIYAWNPNNNAGNIARISGVISSGVGGALTKVGTGKLQLTAANTYSGGTTVSAGTLLLNNTTGSATGSGSVLVNSGTTLGGTGSASGSVNVFGTLAPGESTESLGVGPLTMQSGSKLAIEIGGLTAGATVNGYDQVAVTGSVTLSDADLELSLLSFSPAKGDTFFIVANDGADAVSGIFNGLLNNSLINTGGFLWQIRYNVDFATLNFALGSGNDIALMALPIPEPSTFALLGLGIVGLGVKARRRRRIAA